MSMEPIAKPETLQLRVLTGRVRGANAPLERGSTVVVGHDRDADIVLRDKTTEGVRLTLKTRGDAADLSLIEGEVTLLGHVLTAPAQAVLPTYMPLLIGENAVAIGEPDSPRWAEAERILVSAMRIGEDDDADDEPAIPPPFERWQHMLNGPNAAVSRFGRFIPVALVGVIAIGALSAMATGVSVMRDQPPSAEEVDAALAEAGFDEVSVAEGNNGKLAVTGTLRRDEDRARLQRVIADEAWPVSLNVKTHDGIAAGVEDFYLANGLDASARSVGAGLVRVDVKGGSLEDAEGLKSVALQEIQGVRRIDVSMLPGVDEGGDFESIQEGGGKRVVSVVGGESGYVTTADGSRYFGGAVLPTGHRIMSIENNRVLVERNGARSELSF